MRKIRETQKGLKSKSLRQILVYADDVNLSRENINTIKIQKKKLSYMPVNKIVLKANIYIFAFRTILFIYIYRPVNTTRN
jgi:hypothetical protein